MVKPTDRSQAVSALILRLTERQQIKWMAPDKDNVLHQMVDAGDLADAITALTLFAHALSTPSPDSGERMREAGMDDGTRDIILHVLDVAANYATAEANGGEFSERHRRDLASMNGDVIAEARGVFADALQESSR